MIKNRRAFIVGIKSLTLSNKEKPVPVKPEIDSKNALKIKRCSNLKQLN